MTEKPLARVGLSCGRFFLEVGGVIVAMETDPCRDPKYQENQWNEKNLEEACQRINAQAGVLELTAERA